MSRIGNLPVSLPDGVTAALRDGAIAIKGPKGHLEQDVHPQLRVVGDEAAKQIRVERANDLRQTKAYHGLLRNLIANMVVVVTEGYSKKLEVVGVGWNARQEGQTLRLNVGYCLPVDMMPPQEVEFVINGSVITVSGPDKQAVGQFAAEIRSKRPPEPYNGKGIKYIGEHIIRKQGKVFGA